MSFVEEIVYLVQNIFISKLLKASLMARCGDPVKNVTEKKFDAFIDRVMPWQREYHPVFTQSLI